MLIAKHVYLIIYSRTCLKRPPKPRTIGLGKQVIVGYSRLQHEFEYKPVSCLGPSVDHFPNAKRSLLRRIQWYCQTCLKNHLQVCEKWSFITGALSKQCPINVLINHESFSGQWNLPITSTLKQNLSGFIKAGVFFTQIVCNRFK